MTFEDHFSQFAGRYALFRPGYPKSLFEYLSSQTSGHTLAWDCATGNGQAARDLAAYYDRVVATDASEAQIKQAEPHEGIEYRVEPAEQTSLETASVDLVTVAVAVHWFDFDRFYNEVRRVLKPDGVIAVWTYYRPQIDPSLDALIARLDEEILGPYWPERIRYVHQRYQTLPFPFEPLNPPPFAVQAEWDLDQLLGFFNSWSGVMRFEEARGYHPLRELWDDLLIAWGPADRVRTITWPLEMRVGRV